MCARANLRINSHTQRSEEFISNDVQGARRCEHCEGEQELHDSFKCIYVFKPYSDSDLSESDRSGSVVRFWQSYNPEILLSIWGRPGKAQKGRGRPEVPNRQKLIRSQSENDYPETANRFRVSRVSPSLFFLLLSRHKTREQNRTKILLP